MQPKDFLIGTSTQIEKVRQMITKVAPTNSSVLLTGETGTGKELAAKSIHQLSGRKLEPFVAINCAAIPSELLESELFGHERGAFTGALSTREGIFELAGRGTVFLDEIGDMPLLMQSKLLRTLEDRKVQRVGGKKVLPLKARFIFATHRNLKDAIHKNLFRHDLYYRVNVFPIRLPSLKERPEDVPLLVQALARKLAQREGKKIIFAAGALKYLQKHSWHGNIRELRNMVERFLILFSNTVITPRHIENAIFHHQNSKEEKEIAPPSPYVAASAIDDTAIDDTAIDDTATGNAEHRLRHNQSIQLKKHLTTIEIKLIQCALDKSGQDITHAAKKLGLNRTTLIEKMRRYNLQGQNNLKRSSQP